VRQPQVTDQRTQDDRLCTGLAVLADDPGRHSHPGYDALLAKAAAVRRLPLTASTPESHMAASKLMVDQTDELHAVWDGKPALAYGGTADVVAYAREHGTLVRVIWPDGAQRG
jgi:hypothetical protein